MVEIIGEFCACILFAIDNARAQNSSIFEIVAQITDEFGIFRKAFGDDVARAIKGCLHIGNFTSNILRSNLCGDQPAVGQNGFGKWAKAALAGDFRFGSALGLIGKVEVFKLGFGLNACDFQFEFRRQFFLAADRFEN